MSATPQALTAGGTFAATLLLAPRIDIAVLIGIALAAHPWISRVDIDLYGIGRRALAL
jgi:hypothetical protein